MAIDVRPLTAALKPAYSAFCAQNDGALIYHSLKYAAFLGEILPQARARYLIAVDDGTVVGAMPLFLIEGPMGTVANSLPFYGSHGGPLIASDRTDEAMAALRDATLAVLAEEQVIAATFVENPYATNAGRVAELMPAGDYHDVRIGQISPIPRGNSAETVVEAVLTQCHQKTRNQARKGMRAGFTIVHENSHESMMRLAAMHSDNLRAIGGQVKPPEVFDAIAKNFTYDQDYRVYSAFAADGTCAATMLVLYYKNFVEYFTPCINVGYRADQPLSALILQAMADASMERGSTRWNWGGTWKSQEGVYRFKSRWGAIDTEYRYTILAGKGVDRLLSASTDALVRHYRYFYTLPFSELVS